MLFTENEPSWGIRKEQILSSSELLPNFLNCELEADGWYESLENSISYLSEIAPDDYRVIEAITDSYKAGRELFKNVEDKSKNQLVRTLIFIGFEVGLENDTLFLSEDIIEKLNSAELIDLSDRDKIDFAYRTVCNLLRNGVKIRE